MYRFPPSTTGRYVPGVGTTITQANIALVQTDAARRGDPPLTAEQVTCLFIYGKQLRPEDRMPFSRHLSRAYRLLHGGS